VRRLTRHTPIAFATLLAGGCCLAAPVLASASSPPGSSGGGGIGAAAGSAPRPSQGSPLVGTANVTVSTVGNGISLATKSSALLRGALRFSGTATGAGAGEVVEIERLGRETHWRWEPTVHATPGPGGAYAVVWQTNHIGEFQIRAVMEPAAGKASRINATRASAASPAVTVIVYRPSLATIYGPGLYGRHTACGERLTKTTIGLANRTLPCGMRVALEYGGRTLVVRVIDRGPYANGADWDLTAATAKALGMEGTATIGAVSMPQAP
jgi:rare lipoprotein A